ncbi:DUF7847 domain-containing protein [Streptomyces diastaticus]|uniref:DUF7847 domain-containing protein n=1 Tax=Streptomyces diastaticus TaxID=1956 RepID=UPI00344DD1BA
MTHEQPGPGERNGGQEPGRRPVEGHGGQEPVQGPAEGEGGGEPGPEPGPEQGPAEGPGTQGGPPPWWGAGQPGGGGPAWGPPPPPPGRHGPPPWGWGWGWPPPAPKPGVIPLRPLQTGDLFGGVFATIRRHPGALFGTIALVHGVHLVLAGAVLFAGWHVQRGTLDRLFDTSADELPAVSDLTSVMATFGLVWLVVMVLALVANAAVAVACTTVTREAVLGRPAPFGQVLRAVRRFPTVLGIQLLTGLVVAVPAVLFALFMVLTMVALLARGDVGPWLAFLPFLFLGAGVLAVWLWIRLAVAIPAAVFEGQGAFAAIGRSVRLVRGDWWRTFGLLLLAGAMGMGLSLTVQLITGALQGVPGPVVPDPETGRFDSADVRAVFLDTLAASGVGVLVSSVVQAAAMALTHLTGALVYVDLRIRKEGLADALIAELGQDAEAPRTPPASGRSG